MIKEHSLFFPDVPSNFWKDQSKDKLEALRTAISKWRDNFSKALNDRGFDMGISPKMRIFLLAELQEKRAINWENPLEVLIWRGKLIHFLSDTWDVTGEPEFKMEDCIKASELLIPESFPKKSDHCIYCLDTNKLIDKKDPNKHYFECPVLIKLNKN